MRTDLPQLQYGTEFHCNYANIRIRHFRRAGLSADDNGIAVLNTAFEVKNACFPAATDRSADCSPFCVKTKFLTAAHTKNQRFAVFADFPELQCF